MARTTVIPDTDDDIPDADDYALFKSADTVKAAAKPVKVLDDEDEDEVPERSSMVQAASGWDAANEAIKSASSGFTQDFKFDEDQKLVKFLSDEPVAVYRQHWLKERVGKKSYACIGARCPLCRTLGDAPSPKISFAVLTLSGPDVDEPKVEMLTVGTRLGEMIAKLHQGARTGPLTKGFWAMSKTGSGLGRISYQIQPVKPADAAEDWEIDLQEVNKLIEEAKAKADASPVRFESEAELRKIAREMAV